MLPIDPVQCLADNVYYEAAHEPFDGKVAVAQVALNRADGDAGKVCEAVYFKQINPQTGKKEAAFSWTLGRAWRAPGPKDAGIYAECVWIAQGVLDGSLRSSYIDAGVLYYHAAYVHPAWKGMHFVVRIGNHMFYRR